ncbi:flagellar protein FlgN [Shewanella sp. Scap07]|uniref:flagella synthesis protein FlgN n=1 Tax=Shewanella sp. Scap07 TaxID=2589987 RepID=UPI0015C0E357|nr:flagellar protein FlgN [Shewanella sp. Scap07]QLE86179.1 flagellar protein FlgN [Shewanella sp. Scap07]
MSPINDLIDKQLALLANLKAVTEQEKQALINQSADELLDLAGKKSDLLNEIKANDMSLSAHPDVAQLKSNPELASKVATAQTCLNECQQLNSENATLIDHCMASVSRFTQALHASRNSSSLTYDGKGQTSTIATLGNDLKA